MRIGSRESDPDTWAIIYLGDHVTVTLMQPTQSSRETSSLSSANGLCSCLALLPVGVTWQSTFLPIPVVSYTTFSPLPRGAVCFCGPLRGLLRPGVTRHRALGSADFPQTALAARDCPAKPSFKLDHTVQFEQRQR